jgi:putative nucleotidyltransferase with HDIG domain
MVENPVFVYLDLDLYQALKSFNGARFPRAFEKLAQLSDRDDTTLPHCQRSGAIALRTARLLSEQGESGLTADLVILAGAGGLFHDIGNCRVPYRANDDELRLRHIEQALSLCRELGFSPELTHVVLSHHDAVSFPNGDSYPCGPYYRRHQSAPIDFPDRRARFPDPVSEVARVVWLADKTDKVLVNGGSHNLPEWSDFAARYLANFPPEFFATHRLLAAAGLAAVRKLFFPDQV